MGTLLEPNIHLW